MINSCLLSYYIDSTIDNDLLIFSLNINYLNDFTTFINQKSLL